MNVHHKLTKVNSLDKYKQEMVSDHLVPLYKNCAELQL